VGVKNPRSFIWRQTDTVDAVNPRTVDCVDVSRESKHYWDIPSLDVLSRHPSFYRFYWGRLNRLDSTFKLLLETHLAQAFLCRPCRDPPKKDSAELPYSRFNRGSLQQTLHSPFLTDSAEKLRTRLHKRVCEFISTCPPYLCIDP
jgi:hypothetical protein